MFMAADGVRESFSGGQAENMDETAEDVLDDTCAVFVESRRELRDVSSS